MAADKFTIRGWLVEPDLGRLSRNSTVVHLEPRVMKVLDYLARNRMRVVTKNELIDKVWDDAIVGDAAVARCISQIRQGFGDDARSPKIVETIPKVGYRLIADVGPVPRPASRIRPSRWLAAALLGFVLVAGSNATREGSTTGTLPEFSMPEAGTAYQRGRDMYAKHTYGANRNAVVFFERAIALEPESGFAWAGLADTYVQAARYFDGRELDAAFAAATRAIELAPATAESHAALAGVYVLQGNPESAIDAYRKALILDPGQWSAAYNLGRLHFDRQEYAQAEPLFLQALRYAPDHDAAMSSLGYLYYRTGDIDRARAWYQQVLDRAPLNTNAASLLAMLEMTTGQIHAATDRCDRIVGAFPDQYLCLQVRAVVSLMEGRLEDAYQRFAEVIERHPQDRYAKLGQAKVLLAQSRDAEAQAIVDEVYDRTLRVIDAGEPRSYDYWLVAAVHVLRGQPAKAWQWFERTAEAGRRLPLWDANDPILEPVHGDSRFDRYIAATSVHR